MRGLNANKRRVGPDEDGDPITTMVVDWTSPGAAQPQPEPDPWAAPRRQDQRTAMLRLQRVLMAELAEHGVDLPIPPDGPVVRMIDQEIVRERRAADRYRERHVGVSRDRDAVMRFRGLTVQATCVAPVMHLASLFDAHYEVGELVLHRVLIDAGWQRHERLSEMDSDHRSTSRERVGAVLAGSRGPRVGDNRGGL